jgi:hypothetical protein
VYDDLTVRMVMSVGDLVSPGFFKKAVKRLKYQRFRPINKRRGDTLRKRKGVNKLRGDFYSNRLCYFCFPNFFSPRFFAYQRRVSALSGELATR